MSESENGQPGERWTFLTNHAHVLLCIARDPEVRLRDVAQAVGITERATQRIVADLVRDGYLTRKRIGRRNSYEVHAELPFRHPVEQSNQVGALLSLLTNN
jgi:predicted DNA-binding transcriptional regulator